MERWEIVEADGGVHPYPGLGADLGSECPHMPAKALPPTFSAYGQAVEGLAYEEEAQKVVAHYPALSIRDFEHYERQPRGHAPEGCRRERMWLEPPEAIGRERFEES